MCKIYLDKLRMANSETVCNIHRCFPSNLAWPQQLVSRADLVCNVGLQRGAAALGYDAPFDLSRVFSSVNRLVPTDDRQRKICKSAPGLNGADLASGEEANSISGRIQFQ